MRNRTSPLQQLRLIKHLGLPTWEGLWVSLAERARIAVTKRIRGKIKKLLGTHPELGRHLDAAISTGLYCKYQPERPVEWRL